MYSTVYSNLPKCRVKYRIKKNIFTYFSKNRDLFFRGGNLLSLLYDHTFLSKHATLFYFLLYFLSLSLSLSLSKATSRIHKSWKLHHVAVKLGRLLRQTWKKFKAHHQFLRQPGNNLWQTDWPLELTENWHIVTSKSYHSSICLSIYHRRFNTYSVLSLSLILLRLQIWTEFLTMFWRRINEA